MAVSVQEHEFSPGNPMCLHCHRLRTALLDAVTPYPCITRWQERAEAKPHAIGGNVQMAADDFDAIGLRLKELDAERLRILAETTTIDENLF